MKGSVTDAQFWSYENPIQPDYADKYGVAFSNPDYIIEGTIRSGAEYITRSAPGLGNNSGGAIEVVVNPNSINLTSFTMIE